MIKVKLKEGHTSSGQWILVPISDITTPKDGRICYCDRWWRVTENDEVLFFKAYTSPQCNSNPEVIKHVNKSFNSPSTTPKFIETAFLPHNCGDFC